MIKMLLTPQIERIHLTTVLLYIKQPNRACEYHTASVFLHPTMKVAIKVFTLQIDYITR